MEHNLARRPIELPPERLHLVAAPGGIERLQNKEPTKVVRQHAHTEEDRVGFKLSAGHPLHPETDLELFDPVLTVLASLIVPPKNLLRGFVPVCCNGFVAHTRLTIVKEVSLVRTANYDQTKRVTALVHAVHGL